MYGRRTSAISKSYLICSEESVGAFAEDRQDRTRTTDVKAHFVNLNNSLTYSVVYGTPRVNASFVRAFQ